MKIEIDDKTAAKLVKMAKSGRQIFTAGEMGVRVALAEAVKAARKDKRTQNSAKCKAYREAAEAQYGSDGEIEIDSGAVVSLGDDPGAYVQAWVWVYDH